MGRMRNDKEMLIEKRMLNWRVKSAWSTRRVDWNAALKVSKDRDAYNTTAREVGNYALVDKT
jgi:hypothetical protein